MFTLVSLHVRGPPFQAGRWHVWRVDGALQTLHPADSNEEDTGASLNEWRWLSRRPPVYRRPGRSPGFWVVAVAVSYCGFR